MAGGFFPQGYDGDDKLVHAFLFTLTVTASVGLVVVAILWLTGRVH